MLQIVTSKADRAVMAITVDRDLWLDRHRLPLVSSPVVVLKLSRMQQLEKRVIRLQLRWFSPCR
jgi:hypothetical protein